VNGENSEISSIAEVDLFVTMRKTIKEDRK